MRVFATFLVLSLLSSNLMASDLPDTLQPEATILGINEFLKDSCKASVAMVTQDPKTIHYKETIGHVASELAPYSKALMDSRIEGMMAKIPALKADKLRLDKLMEEIIVGNDAKLAIDAELELLYDKNSDIEWDAWSEADNATKEALRTKSSELLEANEKLNEQVYEIKRGMDFSSEAYGDKSGGFFDEDGDLGRDEFHINIDNGSVGNSRMRQMEIPNAVDKAEFTACYTLIQLPQYKICESVDLLDPKLKRQTYLMDKGLVIEPPTGNGDVFFGGTVGVYGAILYPLDEAQFNRVYFTHLIKSGVHSYTDAQCLSLLEKPDYADLRAGLIDDSEASIEAFDHSVEGEVVVAKEE
ncbi:MAG: hypothetical protein HOE90_13465 [Bacteriovoracaceae bacterium]|jgi:hypothetical protein|nr:hypothetical protein [Bacteriovoracaceae bacterium]